MVSIRPKFHSIRFRWLWETPTNQKVMDVQFNFTHELHNICFICSKMCTFVNESQSVKWNLMPKIFNSTPMFKSFHDKCKLRCESFKIRDRRMIRPCGYPLFWNGNGHRSINFRQCQTERLVNRTIYGGSTTVTVSSSIKYMILTFRIKSYCCKFGSTTFCRKKPSKVSMILSFCTKSGLNGAIGLAFTRPYIHVPSYLIVDFNRNCNNSCY